MFTHPRSVLGIMATGFRACCCITLFAVGAVSPRFAIAQLPADSSRLTRADSVARRLRLFTVEATRHAGTVAPAPRIVAGLVTTGAKSEVVNPVA